MYEYPVTFTYPNGTQVTGFLVLEMPLPQNAFWQLIPASNGVEYSGSPAGNPPAPSFSAIPNFLNEHASVSINVLTTYITPTSGVTCVINGTLPAGWAFNGTTLSYDGTTVNASATTGLTFTATLISSAVKVTSNAFSVQGVGSPSTDVTAPTIPLGISAPTIGTTTASLTGFASSDPSPPGHTWSGMGHYNVTVTGAPGSPFVVASAAGTQPIFTRMDVGPQTTTLSQSGADLTVTTTATDNPYPSVSGVGGGGFQITGTSWLVTWEIDAFSSGNAFDNLRIEARADLTTTGAYVAWLCQPFNHSGGVETEARPASGGSVASIASAAFPAAPVRGFMQRSGDNYAFGYSAGGNAFTTLGSANQAMGSTLFVLFGGNASVPGTVTGTIKQCNVTVLPNWNLNLTGLTAGTSYPVSVTAQDLNVTPNVSAASATFILTTASSGGGGSIPNYPHLAAYRIGGGDAQAYGAAYIAWAAPMINWQIINGSWESWGASNGGRQNKVLAIKAASKLPGGTLVFQYVLLDSIQGSSGSLGTHYSAQNWALYQNGSSGATVASFYNSGWVQSNSAPFVPTDSNGFMLEDYGASYCDAQFRTSGGVNAAPALDGFFHDNLFIKCRSNGDFNRDGTTDNAATAPWPQDWRTGELRFFTQMNVTFPTGLMLGNLDGPAGGSTDPTQYAPLNGALNGGILEGGFGYQFSPNSFAAKLAEYRFRINVCSRGTRNGLVGVGAQISATGGMAIAWDSNGSATSYGTNWMGERYALTLVLLDVGYLIWETLFNHADDSGLTNFDEFGGNTAQYPGGYLGARTGSVPTAAAVKGCWISTFTNGISICAPEGLGGATLTTTDLSAYNAGTLYRLRGPQNPSFNSGAQITSGNPLVLGAGGAGYGDGAILMFAPQ